MGKVLSNGLLGLHSGRASKLSGVYVRVNRQTGKMTTAQLMHPYKGEASQAQLNQRKEFGQISSRVLAWQREGKERQDVVYLQAVVDYRKQHKIGSFLGWCMQKVPDTRQGCQGFQYRAVVKGWVSEPKNRVGGNA